MPRANFRRRTEQRAARPAPLHSQRCVRPDLKKPMPTSLLPSDAAGTPLQRAGAP
jgi:hypothetical protein